jgi:hypothetical protein
MKLGWEADGEWYTGKITNVRVNRHKVKVYACTFETPDRDVLDLDTTETKKLVKAYLDVQEYRKRQLEEHLINKTKEVEETENGEESVLEIVTQMKMMRTVKMTMGQKVFQSTTTQMDKLWRHPTPGLIVPIPV